MYSNRAAKSSAISSTYNYAPHNEFVSRTGRDKDEHGTKTSGKNSRAQKKADS